MPLEHDIEQQQEMLSQLCRAISLMHMLRRARHDAL